MNKSENISRYDYDILYEALTRKIFREGDQIDSICSKIEWTYLGMYWTYLSAIEDINKFNTLQDNQSFYLISVRNGDYKWWYLILQEDLL